MWKSPNSEQKKTTVMDNPCVTCKEEVSSEDRAILCDLCECWEHVVCIRQSERPSQELYEAMVSCRSKALMFACSFCRKRGSIVKRLMQFEYECARAEHERLASARLLEEKDKTVANLIAEVEKLRVERDNVRQVNQPSTIIEEPRSLISVSEQSTQGSKVKDKPAKSLERVTGSPGEHSSSSTSVSSPSEQSSEEPEDEGSRDESHPERRGRSSRPHPPGFKELCSRVDKFSGRTGDCDFELWLEDFEEASKDCGWSDKQRAQWFSWFITGPAKTTWQRTLQSSEKTSWKAIKKVYRGQYGIHLDPRAAYQRCHELRYEQFNSVQGLLDAMRDYQRMAPQKLRDETLESILWNKVPIELQQEVREITDGSVQELLQKLLRAESVIAERKRRSLAKAVSRDQQGGRSGVIGKPQTGKATEGLQTFISKGKDSSNTFTSKAQQQSAFRGEASRQYVKCFNCKRKGHIAVDCPDPPRRNSLETARVIEPGKSTEAKVPSDPWILTVSTKEETAVGEDGTLPRRGPTYKVVAEVDGIRTRALLDHGAQISLVRQELLPVIQKKHGWTKEQYQQRNLPLDSQPIGASGDPLGVMAVVMLKVTIEQSEKTFQVPCYVLKSDKPLWNGELQDCALVLGTNALENLGFQIIHPSGGVVQPVGAVPGSETQNTQPTVNTVHVILDQKLRIGPFQSKVAKVSICNSESVISVGVIKPNNTLSSLQCDFVEELWKSKSTGNLSVTNWSGEPLTIEPGTMIGDIEEVSVVDSSDPVWSTPPVEVARVSQWSEKEIQQRKVQLKSQLVIGGTCSEEEQSKFKQFLLSKHNSFAMSDTELGETDIVEHSIDTGDAKPVKTFPRRLPYALRKELEEELKKLTAAGCVEPSTSPYASGLVLVRKKDGSLRVCVDYRKINQETVPDRYPMPRVDELVDAIGRRKGKYFSTLDMMKGYHQVKMEKQSKCKTAFTCHLGLFQYRRMPFGLTNAPATFQRLMDKLFSGKEWDSVFVYLDDILIVSASFEDHLREVGRVLDRLSEVGLCLKPSKCSFARKEVEYLGFTISAEGVRPNQAKVKAISDFPQPTDSTSVKRFLGMLNFYRRHVPNLAAVARPLTALTRKDQTTGGTVPFKWTSECEAAFTELKQKLVTAPVLKPPDLSKPFFVWTDASMIGFGAVLEQLDEQNQRHPIAFASRQTNPAERKYAPTELEVAALIFAVEHFEVYLLGNQFTVYTDHQALVSAFLVHLKSQTRGLLARWYLRIAKFLPQMKLEYKPGSANVVADALSRAPVESKASVLQVSQEMTTTPEEAATTSLCQVQSEQRKDKELVKIMDFLADKTLPVDPLEAKTVLSMAGKGYVLVDGILYYESEEVPNRRRVVVPEHLRQRILDEHHDLPFSGHFAARKMSQRISQYYFWIGLKGDVHKKCSSCVTCASVKGQGNRGKPPLVNIPVEGPFDCVGMDFVEMDVSRDGNRYALVIQDYLTKWPEVYALPNRKAETVAKCLLDLVSKHGVPNKIIHDRAAEFLSDVLQDTAALLGIDQLPTSGGHPQTDGLVERFNRTLKQMLAKMVTKKGRDWDTLLGPVLFAYRTTPHSSTGMSPFMLLYGRVPRLPTALDFQVPVSRYPTVETEYGQELAKELKKVREIAKQTIQKKQKEQKKFYDRGSKEVELKIGDRVMLKVGPRFKLDRSFKGPFIVKSLTPTNAMIQLQGDSNAEQLNVSRQRLSRCSTEISTATPWVGHSGKLRKRRRVRQKKKPESATADKSVQSGTSTNSDGTGELKVTNSSEPRISRSGRQIRTPARFLHMNRPQVNSQKRGEVVRSQLIQAEERAREQEACAETKKLNGR